MKTVVFDVVVVLALAVAGAAIVFHAYDGSLQTAGDDQPQPPTRETAVQTQPAAPVTDYVIDDEGMPLLIPVRSG